MFIVRQKPHPVFVRQLNDLIYKTNITLEMVGCEEKRWADYTYPKYCNRDFHQALTGFSVDMETLDGRLLNIPINDIVQ